MTTSINFNRLNDWKTPLNRLTVSVPDSSVMLTFFRGLEFSSEKSKERLHIPNINR